MFRFCLVSLALAGTLISRPVLAGGWRSVTEAGVTIQPGDSPIERDGSTTHWRWTGVAGGLRKIGSSQALGPVFLGSYTEHDFTLGAGLRWEHDLVPPWSFVLTPGFAVHDRVRADVHPFRGYFAEVGFSYRRSITLAARLEGIRYVRQNDVGDPPGDPIIDRVLRLDLRMGRAPGAVALGAAAAALLVFGIGRATGPD